MPAALKSAASATASRLSRISSDRPFLARQEGLVEARKQLRETVGAELVGLGHRQQLDEEARKLDEVIVRAPGMPVARADRKAEPPVEIGGRVEIAHRVDDVVEAARHRVAGHFTAENAVGCRNMLLIEATIGPSFSLSARLVTHSGSVANLFHFCSRSASDSQASR